SPARGSGDRGPGEQDRRAVEGGRAARGTRPGRAGPGTGARRDRGRARSGDRRASPRVRRPHDRGRRPRHQPQSGQERASGPDRTGPLGERHLPWWVVKVPSPFGRGLGEREERSMASVAAAKRYARAAFAVALEHGALDRWLADLTAAERALGAPRVMAYLKNPKVTR